MNTSNPNTNTAENNTSNENDQNGTTDPNNIQENLKNLTLNSKAKEYVPRKNKANEPNITSENAPEKLNLNLNAEEYKPKNTTPDYQNPYQIKQVDNETNEEDEELENDELDMIVNDLVENDAYEEFEEEESDDEKWFPKYKDCECCKGFIYKCKGSACTNMGVCYCKMKDECDDEY